MYRLFIVFTIIISGALPLSSLSSSGVWWHGQTRFTGEVIASACTLAMEDIWQEVNMGSISLRELKNGFTGPEKKFHLRLRNCELIGGGRQVYTASRIRVTFDSLQEENSDKFLLTGQARGIALQILDPQGYLAHVGQAMPPLLLTGDEEKLDYTLRIVRDGKPLKAGNYYSVLRFRVDYE